MGDSDLSRRGFLTLTGGAALASTAGCLSGDDTGPAAFLLGPDANKPAPGSEFFDNKEQYRYLYLATDTGVRYSITTDESTWSAAALGGGNDTRPVDELPVGGVAAAFDNSSDEFILRARPGSDEGYEARVSGNRVLNAIPNSGVSRWTFDNADTSGSTAVDVWGSNDATINGATSGFPGANQTYTTNEAYDFDGSDDDLEVPDDNTLDGLSEISISFWTYLDSIGSNDETFINKDDSSFSKRTYRVYVTSGDFSFRIGDGISNYSIEIDGGSPTTGVWTFITATFDGSTARLYVDNTQVDSQSKSVSIPDTNTTLRIGNSHDGRYIDGRIDDVRIYNKGLSSSEVSNLYNTGSIN